MAQIILLMANIDLDRRNLWRKFLNGGEKTAIGYVRAALILRVKEPIGGTRVARVQLRYHVWFKGSLKTSNLSVGATRYSIP
jgi:hypothetical protein